MDKTKLKHYTADLTQGDGDWIENSSFTRKFDEADIIIFPGGQDCSPVLYKEKSGYHTQIGSNIISERDKREMDLFDRAVNSKKFIFGICKGEQLLTILNGGKLVQHMYHGNGHTCKTWDNQVCYTNSLHHQLAYPWDIPKQDWELIMWTEGISNTYLNGDDKEIDFHLDAFTDEGLIIEPEGLWFPKTRSMGVQWHPEFMGYSGWGWNLHSKGDEVHTLDYLNKLLLNLFENPNYIKEQKLILLNDEN